MILLGKTVEIIASTNQGLVGLRGEVVEDTESTLVLRTASGEKRVVKNTLTLKIDGFIIEGKSLAGTHPSRVKKNK